MQCRARARPTHRIRDANGGVAARCRRRPVGEAPEGGCRERKEPQDSGFCVFSEELLAVGCGDFVGVMRVGALAQYCSIACSIQCTVCSVQWESHTKHTQKHQNPQPKTYTRLAALQRVTRCAWPRLTTRQRTSAPDARRQSRAGTHRSRVTGTQALPAARPSLALPGSQLPGPRPSLALPGC